MAEAAVQIKVGKRGDLRLPAKMLRQAQLQPEEVVTVRIEEKRIVVEPVQKEFTYPSEVLEELHRQGKIRLSDFGDALKKDMIPGTTLDQLHAMLKGRTVPVEEYLREERGKVDDPFRD